MIYQRSVTNIQGVLETRNARQKKTTKICQLNGINVTSFNSWGANISQIYTLYQIKEYGYANWFLHSTK